MSRRRMAPPPTRYGTLHEVKIPALQPKAHAAAPVPPRPMVHSIARPTVPKPAFTLQPHGGVAGIARKKGPPWGAGISNRHSGVIQRMKENIGDKEIWEVALKYAENTEYMLSKEYDDFTNQLTKPQWKKLEEYHDWAGYYIHFVGYSSNKVPVPFEQISIQQYEIKVPISSSPETIDPEKGSTITGPAIDKRGMSKEKWCYCVLGFKKDNGSLQKIVNVSNPGGSALLHAERNACKSLCERFDLGNWPKDYQSDGEAFGKALLQSGITIEFIYTEFPPCPSGCDKWVSKIGAKKVYYSTYLEGWYDSKYAKEKDKMWKKHIEACVSG